MRLRGIHYSTEIHNKINYGYWKERQKYTVRSTTGFAYFCIYLIQTLASTAQSTCISFHFFKTEHISMMAKYKTKIQRENTGCILIIFSYVF